jgi:hypothetical protein
MVRHVAQPLPTSLPPTIISIGTYEEKPLYGKKRFFRYLNNSNCNRLNKRFFAPGGHYIAWIAQRIHVEVADVGLIVHAGSFDSRGVPPAPRKRLSWKSQIGIGSHVLTKFKKATPASPERFDFRTASKRVLTLILKENPSA